LLGELKKKIKISEFPYFIFCEKRKGVGKIKKYHVLKKRRKKRKEWR
jgi:hypothetical protein